jgi:hypothetical protein
MTKESASLGYTGLFVELDACTRPSELPPASQTIVTRTIVPFHEEPIPPTMPSCEFEVPSTVPEVPRREGDYLMAR